jgi:hypothetical protein
MLCGKERSMYQLRARDNQESAPPRRPRAVSLRELGVYVLPDGREYVVSTLYSDGCCLYPRRAWEAYGEAEFWVDEAGHLLRRGEPTRWIARDLADTGRTAQYPKPVIF